NIGVIIGLTVCLGFELALAVPVLKLGLLRCGECLHHDRQVSGVVSALAVDGRRELCAVDDGSSHRISSEWNLVFRSNIHGFVPRGQANLWMRPRLPSVSVVCNPWMRKKFLKYL